VAHFLYSVLAGQSITVYGDGYQVRDVLHVQDLIDGMLAARRAAGLTRGQVYNLGGGLERAVSVIEMLKRVERKLKRPLKLDYSEVRPGDQPLYVADTRKLETDTGWKPRRSLEEILDGIYEFRRQNEGFWRESGTAATMHDKEKVLEKVVA
jgi:CDP-paratose 2-epimerase